MANGRRSKTSAEKLDKEEAKGFNDPISLMKELLAVQENTVKAFFATFVESTNCRIDNLIKEVHDLKTSLQLTKAEVDELKNVNCTDRLKKIESNIEALQNKADDLENRSRRNNLCFEGIEESRRGNETWEQSEEKIKDQINSILMQKISLLKEPIELEQRNLIPINLGQSWQNFLAIKTVKK